MVQVKAYLLENEHYYNEIDSVYYNDTKYMLLANEDDQDDICIRKFIHVNDEDCLSLLTDDEFEKVREILIDKNKALFN